MYLRKSSESEERQELSIPAQARELQALASRKGLVVVGKPYEESRSAREPGRPLFNEVLQRVERGEAEGILCWKLDRLARNPIDGGQIIHALGKGIIQSVLTSERQYIGNADDKFMMSIFFGQATKYVDDLSVDVRRGNREALEQGRWPGKPKLGYRRDHATMRLIADEPNFSLMQELWRRALSGTRPAELLCVAREEMQLTTPVTGKVGGKLISKTALYRMFRDPFYAGFMPYRGKTFAGTHPSMVTPEEFKEVQRLVDQHVRPMAKPQRLWFTYRGLVICGRCQAAVTAKYTTNRLGTTYLHYFCCRKVRRYNYCPEGAVREEVIDDALATFLQNLRPPEHWLAALREQLTAWEDRSAEVSTLSRNQVTTRLSEIDAQLRRLRQFLLRQVVSEGDYQAEHERLMRERLDAEAAVRQLAEPVALIEHHDSAVKLLSEAEKIFERGTREEKRAIVESLIWNMTLENKSVRIVAKKPFAYFSEWSRCPELSAWIDYVRTQLAKNGGRFAAELTDPRMASQRLPETVKATYPHL